MIHFVIPRYHLSDIYLPRYYLAIKQHHPVLHLVALIYDTLIAPPTTLSVFPAFGVHHYSDNSDSITLSAQRNFGSTNLRKVGRVVLNNQEKLRKNRGAVKHLILLFHVPIQVNLVKLVRLRV